MVLPQTGSLTSGGTIAKEAQRFDSGILVRAWWWEAAARQRKRKLYPSPAPGNDLLALSLNREVISCIEAATTKGIPLENELKTLIIRTSYGPYAVHIRGNMTLSLRAVKRYLNQKQACMGSCEYIQSFGLLPGAVCAVLNPVWGFQHLVSANLLSLDYVSTNNGTRDRYLIFSPRLLLDAERASVGDFEA